MLSLFLWMACSPSAPPSPEAPTPPAVEGVPDGAGAEQEADHAMAEVEAVAAAEAAAMSVAQAMRQRLQSAMSTAGPEGAVTACADEAQGLTALAVQGQRARAGRSSLRLRNPSNQGPDWVQEWLREQGERPAEGVEGLSEAHVADGVVVGRRILPIPVEGVCLTCHGGPDEMASGVQAIVAERYPTDQATGYAVGDLRGALWAEVRLPVGR